LVNLQVKQKSPILFRTVSLIFTLLWMGLIFYLSHQNAAESDNVSGGFIESIVKFFIPDASPETLAKWVENLNFVVRKLAHVSAYFVLGILTYMSVSTYKIFSSAYKVALSLTICLGYSVSDEYHQTFISGRSGELRDVGIDSIGIVSGVTLTFLIHLIYKRIKNRKRTKMKKQQYIELTEALKKELRKTKNELETLTRENKSLSDEVNALNCELFELRQRLSETEEELKEKQNPLPEPSMEAEIIPEETVAEDTTVLISDDMEYGAEIIGKIVLSATKYCNQLSIEATAQNKELINLIFGRAEVAKFEILKITDSDMASSLKKTAMEDEALEAEDYFKSVMAQK